MTEQSESQQLDQLVNASQHILIIQADNPDADSLSSALALDEILSEKGKQVSLYCGIDIPVYLSYIKGWDRVSSEIPKQFDMSIIVDNSSSTLLEQLDKSGSRGWVAAKPTVIIDHHATQATITFAQLAINREAVSTTEVIYEISREINWTLNQAASELIAIGILSDSLGLTTQATSARTLHVMAELVEQGVVLAELENARKESMRREPELIAYKGRLLERVEFLDNGRIAAIKIPQNEINQYSPLYNPPMLVIDDMRLAKGTELAVAFKVYDDGKITGKIRCNYGIGIADKLAEHFGGGGHAYAAGFKLQGKPYDDVKKEFVEVASGLLNEVSQ